MRSPLLITVFVGIAGVAAFAAVAAPSGATPQRRAEIYAVRLGTHRFGRVAAPAAVVAKAAAGQLGFPSEGSCCGPNSFEIARDGSVWVLDGGNQRLVVWKRGQPSRIAQTIALPKDCCEDFALARGAIYVTQSGIPTHPLNFLYRLKPDGNVVWRATLAAQGFPVPLRVGPDGRLYSVYTRRWQPATTRAGNPLTVARQRQGATRSQPLAGGRRLVSEVHAHQARFDLLDRSGRLVRRWRVSSRTRLEPVLEATPALVQGDPVVFMTVWTEKPFRWQYLVLRLAPSASGTRARVSLGHRSPLAGWGDMVTDLRVGPDGALYQLGTSPQTGLSIRRYSLGR
jgi:hypothetical protein